MIVASVSCGKDSLAMTHEWIERGNKIDEVVMYDNGMEFLATYYVRDKFIQFLDKNGIPYTILYPRKNFNYQAFDVVVNKNKPNQHNGYGWCGGRCRWGTEEKNRVIKSYLRKKDAKVLVGIAYDEKWRVKDDPNKIYPLIDYEMTEDDCLKKCYDLGYTWEEDGVRLYDILDRVSCWCCSNKNINELRNIYHKMPKYWKMLLEYQSKTEHKMKKYGSVFDLDKRFKEEDEKCLDTR